MRAIDVVRRVAPKARPEYLDAFERGDALLQAAGIDTPIRLAHFLAQVLHESMGLQITQENMNYRSPERIMEIFGQGRHSAAVTPSEAERLAGRPAALAERVYGLGNPRKARELGNLNPGDGWKYRGGGIMQTTGRTNYRRIGEKCGVDFEARPELAYAAAHALRPALAEWTEGGLNAMADADNLRAITKRINGGYNGLADREHWYRKVRPLIDTVAFEAVANDPAPKPVSKPAPLPPKAVPAATGAAGGIAAIVAAAHGYGPVAVVALAVVVAVALYFWIKRRR